MRLLGMPSLLHDKIQLWPFNGGKIPTLSDGIPFVSVGLPLLEGPYGTVPEARFSYARFEPEGAFKERPFRKRKGQRLGPVMLPATTF
jgi:hypothetical protein